MCETMTSKTGNIAVSSADLCLIMNTDMEIEDTFMRNFVVSFDFPLKYAAIKTVVITLEIEAQEKRYLSFVCHTFYMFLLKKKSIGCLHA